MAQMFCTLKQAADRLETTEAEIEAMLNDGILREFRDGSHRLLKVADLAGLTVSAGVTEAERRPARAECRTGSTRPATVQRRIPHATGRMPAATRRRPIPPRAVVISPPMSAQRPRPQMYEMSLRQWIWTGLLDDSPLAIFIVFGTLLLGAGTLAGAAYLLLHGL